MDEQSLSLRLDEFVEDPSLTSGSPNVIKVPPTMTPVPCKPLFFDLALNQISFPSLSENMESKKSASGITGFVKGLWGWGGKWSGIKTWNRTWPPRKIHFFLLSSFSILLGVLWLWEKYNFYWLVFLISSFIRLQMRMHTKFKFGTISCKTKGQTARS